MCGLFIFHPFSVVFFGLFHSERHSITWHWDYTLVLCQVNILTVWQEKDLLGWSYPKSITWKSLGYRKAASEPGLPAKASISSRWRKHF
jgi:hypothetical protein